MNEDNKKKDLDYLLGRKPPQQPSGSFLARYLCARCDFFFEFNPTLGKGVRCPVCRGTKCVPKSPAVHVTKKTEVTGRGIKKLRMMTRTRKLLRQLMETRNLFVTYLRSLGLDEEIAKKVSIAMDEALAEARKESEKKMSRY